MQRPTSVTVFGVLNIVFGALGLLGTLFSGAALFMVNAQQRRMPGMEELNPIWEAWLKISVVMALVGAVALITSGFGLLGLRRWGRLLAIGYAVYAIANCVLGVVMQYVFVTQPLLERLDNPNGRQTGLFVVGISLGSSCVGLIYPLLLGYFMSRPHVVAAFNGLSGPVDAARGFVAPGQDTWEPVDAGNPYAASGTVAAAPPVMGIPQYSATESIVETFVPSRNGAALVAYYCGVFSLFPCLGFPLGVVAVYYGLKGLRAERENPAVRGGVHAWVGVICGALFGFFNLLLCVAAVIGISAAILDQ